MTSIESRQVDADVFHQDRSLPQVTLNTVTILVPLASDFPMLVNLGQIKGRYEDYLERINETMLEMLASGVDIALARWNIAEFLEFCAENNLESETEFAHDRFARHGVRALCWRDSVAEFLIADKALDLMDTLDEDTAHEIGHAAIQLVDSMHDFTHEETENLHWEVAVSFLDDAGQHQICTPTFPPDCMSENDHDTLTLLCAAALMHSGSAVLRIISKDTLPDGTHRSTVRGWTIGDGNWVPLTSGQMFSLACVDPGSGDPIPPAYGVEYLSAIFVPPEQD